MSRSLVAGSIAAAAALTLSAAAAVAQIAVSAQDGKVKLENGKVITVKDGSDTIALIDLGQSPPKVLAELKVAASIVGPPQSVAVSAKEEIALVTAAEALDPADPTKRIPADTLTVIELNTKPPGVITKVAARIRGKTAEQAPPKVLATLKAGKGAAGVAINRAGTLALVANRMEDTVSVFAIKGKEVTPVGEKLKIGDGKQASMPAGIVFSADGKRALVTRDGDSRISILNIDGQTVTIDKREMSAGMRPYGIDLVGKGDVAVVANIGAGTGDADTVSVIDLAANPPRIVNTVTVGPTPEGIRLSPDGLYVAVTVTNGSTRASGDPFFNDKGKLVILKRAGNQLTRVADADIGRWCQGIAWASNSRTLVAQCHYEQQLFVFGFNGRQLTAMSPIPLKGGPAGIGTAVR